MAKNMDEFNVYHAGPLQDRNSRTYTDINDIKFCVKYVDTKTINQLIADIVLNSQELEDVYEDPSPAKQNKYNLWRSWADQIRNLYCFGIINSTPKDYDLVGYLDIDYDKQAVIQIRPGKYLPDACVVMFEK